MLRECKLEGDFGTFKCVQSCIAVGRVVAKLHAIYM